MHYLRLPIVLCLSFCFWTCEDDDSPMPVQEATIDFGGVHLTDYNGQPIGGGDPTDWNLQDTWEDRVFAFFNNEQRDLCNDPSDYQAFSAFPNPAQDLTSLLYELKDSADLQLRIVDRDYKLLRETNAEKIFGPGRNQINIRLDDLNVTDTVRFYYKLIGKNCELRGHGDVIIK